MTTPSSGEHNSLPDDSASDQGTSRSDSPSYAPPSGAQTPTPQYGQVSPAPPSGQPQYGMPQNGSAQYGNAQAGQFSPAPPSGAQTPTPQYGQYAPAPPQGQPQYGAPQYGAPQYGAPQGGNPQFGNQQVPPGAPQGAFGGGFGSFNATLKPGIIPLRPLSLLEIYDGVFGAIRRAPGVVLGLVGVVVAVFVAIATVLAFVVLPWFNSITAQGAGNAVSDTLNDPIFEASGLDAMSISLTLMISLVVPVATIIASGIVVVAIGQLVLNSKITASQAWIKVSPRIMALFGVFFFVSVLPGIAYAVLVVVISYVASLASEGAFITAMILSLIIGFFLYLYLQIRWVFAPSALVLEERGVFASLKRSAQLTKGSFFRVIGYYLLTSLGMNAVLSFVTQMAVTLLMVIGGEDFLSQWWGLTGYALISAISTTIQVGVLSAVITLLYIDIRMRREALDLELIAAANKQL